ncbi:uncharacterized protein [Haliotis asinina]|uniref:uncharacterized protein n=1 Tax=Haliotis asinina TaxID=109174 RepID=UPI0035320D04
MSSEYDIHACFDLLVNETPGTTDKEGDSSSTSSESSMSSADGVQACCDVLGNETPNTGDKEVERYSTSFQSWTSSVDGVQACSDLLGKEKPETSDREGEYAQETTLSVTLDREDTPNTGNKQQLKSKSTRNENLIVSECGQVPSETLKDLDQNQVTTPSVGFCDLPSGAEEDERSRQYRDSNSKRDSCDAHKTKVLGSALSITHPKVLAPSSVIDPDITDPKVLASSSVIDQDITDPKMLAPSSVIDPDITDPRVLGPSSVMDPDITDPKVLASSSVIDQDITDPKVLAPSSVMDPDITDPKVLAPSSVMDPDITHPKVLAPSSVTDPDITHPKVLAPSPVMDPDITDPKVLAPSSVMDPDITVPKVLRPSSVMDPDITDPKVLAPSSVMDPDITHPKVLGPSSVTDPDITDPKVLAPSSIRDPDITDPKVLVSSSVMDPDITDPKVLGPSSVMDPDITDPRVLALSSVIDQDITDPKMLALSSVIDPHITHPKVLAPSSVMDSDITDLKVLAPSSIMDADITDPKVLGPSSVTDPDTTDPRVLGPSSVIDQDIKAPKMLAPSSVIDPDITDPNMLAPSLVTDPDITDSKVLAPSSVTDPDITDTKMWASPSVTDPEITNLKMLVSPSVADPDREYGSNGRMEYGQSSSRLHFNLDKYDTSLGSTDSGIGDGSDEESANNVPQQSDETYPKEVIASDHADIYKSVENLSTPNSYSVLNYPENTFLRLILQPDMNDNAAKSQHMASRKDSEVVQADKAGNNCDDVRVQREETDNREETHPKEVAADHDHSESMTELGLSAKETTTPHRINQIWIDDKTTLHATVDFNFPLDLEGKNIINNNAFKMKKDTDISNQTDSFKQDVDNTNFTSAAPANEVDSPCSDPDPEEIIPNTTVQQQSPKQLSASEDIDYSIEILSPELSQGDQSIIMSENSSTNCDSTTLPETNEYTVIHMPNRPLDMPTSYNPTHESNNMTCNDMHRREILLQNLQRTLQSCSLKDTGNLSTDFKNLILTDSSVIRQHMRLLADLMKYKLSRNPDQEPCERGTDAKEPKHNDENNISHNLKQGNKKGNPRTHSSYFNQKENDWHDPLSSTRSHGMTVIDDKKYITAMNDVSGKEIKDLELSKTEPSIEPVHQTQIEPDLQPSSQSFEQEATYNPLSNTCTHGRSDLSLGVQQHNSDDSDARLGKEEIPEMTSSSQEGRQDVQTGQSYSLHAKMQDYLGRLTTVEISECQQTANDSNPQDSGRDLPQPQDSYIIPSKLQEYGSSDGSVSDSDTDEITDIPQIPSNLSLSPGMDMSYSTQPDPVQQQTESQMAVSDSELNDILQPHLESKPMSYNLDDLNNLTHDDSQQHGISHSTQPLPDIDGAQLSEQAVKQTFLPMGDLSFQAAEVRIHDYSTRVRMSDDPLQMPSCNTRQIALNTVKIISNEYMEAPQTKEKQCLNVKTPDSLKRQSDSERPLLDQERQNIFDNSLLVASATNRVTIRSNQCESYLRVPDIRNLRQEFASVVEVFVREVEAGGQEEEDDQDDDTDDEENVQQNPEN